MEFLNQSIKENFLSILNSIFKFSISDSDILEKVINIKLFTYQMNNWNKFENDECSFN